MEEHTEKKTAVLRSHARRKFCVRRLWAVRDTRPDSVEGVNRASQVLTGVRLPHVRAEGALGLVRQCIRVVEVIVPLGVNAERGIVCRWCEVDRRTALPATKHARAEEFCTFLLGEIACTVGRNSIGQRVGVELRDLLLEVAERHETAVESPWRTSARVAVASCEDDSWRNNCLSGEDSRLPTCDGGLRDAVEEAKVCKWYEIACSNDR